MPELTTFKLKCPACKEIMELDADAAELEAEDGAYVACLSCHVESEYSFSDFRTSADDFDLDDEDDDEGEDDDQEDDDDDEEEAPDED